jgi:hypothetical protein
MASLTKVTDTRRARRDKKKLVKRQKSIKKEIALKHAVFMKIFGKITSA